MGFCLEEDGLLHNFTTVDTQSMNGIVPWRGPREKDPAFMQILIEALSKPGDIIMDCTASTGMCF